MARTLELRQCRYFLAVAGELHFGRAAQRLGMAQPPLSRSIRNLEKKIGAPLFERFPRVELTDAGRAFEMQARAVLAQAERTVDTAVRIARHQALRLRIGYTHLTDPRLLMNIQAEFRRTRPDARLSLTANESAVLCRQVQEGAVDVAFVVHAACDGQIASEPFNREPIAVALPERHSLLHRPHLTLQDLAGEGFLPPPSSQSPELHEKFVEICRALGFEPRLAHESPHLHATLAMISAGEGVCVMPAFLEQPWPGVVYRKLHGSVAFIQMAFVWREDETREIVRAFLAAVRRHSELAMAESA